MVVEKLARFSIQILSSITRIRASFLKKVPLVLFSVIKTLDNNNSHKLERKRSHKFAFTSVLVSLFSFLSKCGRFKPERPTVKTSLKILSFQED